MNFLRSVALIASSLLAWPAVVSAQGPEPNKIWTNQRGSTLTIQSIAPDGSFTGVYISRAKGFQCKDSPYPVTGWIDGSNIAFTVRFQNATPQDCHTIASWVGYQANNQLLTDWNLVYANQQGQPTYFHGKDIFQ